MKRILFILLLLPTLLRAESFSYNQLTMVQEGSDNFSMDRGIEKRISGTIEFTGTSISIDKKSYGLKATKLENCYKSKRGTFRMVYSGSRLAYVQHFCYGKVYNYRIQYNADPLRGRNSG